MEAVLRHPFNCEEVCKVGFHHECNAAILCFFPSKSGYRLVRKTEKEWVATWGKSMKPVQFRTMQENQKVNHFPGTFHIGRKDRLWKNYRRLQLKYGEEEFDFLPRTFCLPADEHLLRKVSMGES